MTGQIPPYGQGFRLARWGYDEIYSHSVYVSKRDEEWFIRSDKTSKRWFIFCGYKKIGPTYPTLTVAMQKVTQLLDIIQMR